MRSFQRFLGMSILAVAGCFGLGISAANSQQPAAKAAQSAPAAGDLIDINTATPDQIKALPGIGDAYSKRIIAGRPYTAKNQLVTRGIVPQATYDKMQMKIVAKRPNK